MDGGDGARTLLRDLDRSRVADLDLERPWRESSTRRDIFARLPEAQTRRGERKMRDGRHCSTMEKGSKQNRTKQLTNSYYKESQLPVKPSKPSCMHAFSRRLAAKEVWSGSQPRSFVLHWAPSEPDAGWGRETLGYHAQLPSPSIVDFSLMRKSGLELTNPMYGRC